MMYMARKYGIEILQALSVFGGAPTNPALVGDPYPFH